MTKTLIPAVIIASVVLMSSCSLVRHAPSHDPAGAMQTPAPAMARARAAHEAGEPEQAAARLADLIAVFELDPLVVRDIERLRFRLLAQAGRSEAAREALQRAASAGGGGR